MMILSEMTRIDRTIEIAAPPERVWRALTDARELSDWFQVTIDGEIRVGNEVWMTSTHTGYEGQRFAVEFVELTPPRRMVWRWHPGAVDPAVDYSREARTTVTFTLEPAGRGTQLTMAETGFDEITLARRAAVYKDNNQGWDEVLGQLQTYVEAKR
jgi:uncharacterized protein YndB with AHSA1/START domain